MVKFTYPNVRQYLAEKYYFLLRDVRYPFYQGAVAFVSVVFGKGAFRQGDDVKVDNDPFKYVTGVDRFMKKVEPINHSADQLQSAFNGDSPLVKENTFETIPDDTREYGYGFWFRYMTHYPARMWNGKNEAWYFLARLTSN